MAESIASGSEFSNTTTTRCSIGTEPENRNPQHHGQRRHAINITNNPGYQVKLWCERR